MQARNPECDAELKRAGAALDAAASRAVSIAAAAAADPDVDLRVEVFLGWHQLRQAAVAWAVAYVESQLVMIEPHEAQLLIRAHGTRVALEILKPAAKDVSYEEAVVFLGGTVTTLTAADASKRT